MTKFLPTAGRQMTKKTDGFFFLGAKIPALRHSRIGGGNDGKERFSL
jgi:hypothetical protein